jgi:hypothetical protein
VGVLFLLVDFDFPLVLGVVEDFDVVCEPDFLGVEVFAGGLCVADCGVAAAPDLKELVSRKPSSTTV